MTDSPLLNEHGTLDSSIESQLRRFRKTKPMWAKLLHEPVEVQTLEGPEVVPAGAYLCRGIKGEPWGQSAEKVSQKYVPSGEPLDDGWEKFLPHPDAPPVDATKIPTAFRVHTSWGELSGKPGDYLVRSTTDLTDMWIVDQSIFDSTYESC